MRYGGANMWKTPLVGVLAAVVIAAGCAGGGDSAASPGPPAESGRQAPGPAAAPGPGAGGDAAGIGASQARASGVLSAPYDAALRGPDRTAAGRATLRLVNTGTRADAYRITVQPAGAATLTPSTAWLASGAAATVDVRLVADASVHVFSVGRDAEVADLPLSLG
jgi:hypothetical protein